MNFRSWRFLFVMTMALWWGAMSGVARDFVAAWPSAAHVPLTTNGYRFDNQQAVFSLQFAPPRGTVLTVIDNTSINPLEGGTFTNLGQHALLPMTFQGTTFHFRADYAGGDGNDLVLVLVGLLEFTAMPPVYDPVAQSFGPFPGWEDMRSAWGDFDADGDLDVVLMGGTATGPMTKLFINDPSSAARPIAFGEAVTNPALPQLQDGALAWGDMDNDGDLDLALTGSVRAAPAAPGELRLHILRNNGPGAFSAVQFAETAFSPLFTRCHLGCLSWGDVEHDGDLDLFVSGMAWNPATNRADLPFARIYRNYQGNLDPDSSLLLLPDGTAREMLAAEPLPALGMHIGGVTWTDVDRDSWMDFILADALFERDASVGLEVAYGQQVWLKWRERDWGRGDPGTDPALRDLRSRIQSGLVSRLGQPMKGLPLFEYGTGISTWDPDLGRLSFTDLFGTSSRASGAGDWDGDGRVDLMFPGYIDGGGALGSLTKVLRQDGRGRADDFLPGFFPLNDPPLGDHPDFQPSTCTSADLLNEGRHQWLANVFAGSGDTIAGLPEFSVLGHDPAFGLSPMTFPGGITARFRGALDAVDIDRNGRLELFVSGKDEMFQEGTELYEHTGSVNTAPTAPAGLTEEVTHSRVKFSWSASTDGETRPEALRYAVRLRRQGEEPKLLVAPGATAAGVRLLPGLDGTLSTTYFVFSPHYFNELTPVPDGLYFWTVQSVDSAGKGSPFAPERSFRIGPPPNTPPVATGEHRADLAWRDAAMDAGDCDNDGDLDLVLAGRSLSGAGGTIIQRNDGLHPTEPDTFAFSTMTPELPTAIGGAVRWGDVDGDGDLDLALCGTSQGQPFAHVYRNRGDGVMELHQVLHGVERGALDWGDCDNDGDLDLIVTGYRDKRPLTVLYRNGAADGTRLGVLIEQGSSLPSIGNGAAAWGDYDGDGDLDLLLCGDTRDYDQPLPPCLGPSPMQHPPGTSWMCGVFQSGQTPNPLTAIFRNEGLVLRGKDAGKWRFQKVDAALPPLFSYSGGKAVTARAEWCDMTGDGRPDLLLGGMIPMSGRVEFSRPTASVFLNTGPGQPLGSWTFQQGGELLAASFEDALQALTCADWNGGGWPDVLMSGWLNGPGTVPAQLLIGDGGRYFLPQAPLAVTLPGNEKRFAGGPAVFGHFDNDARLDVVLNGRWGITTSGGIGGGGTGGRLFLNQGSINHRPTPPDNLTATASADGTRITFSWGESSDGINPVRPSYNLHVERTDGQPGGMPGMADNTTGLRRVARHGNVWHHRAWTLRNLPAGEYRWRVQAIDSALATSAFTTAGQNFTALPPAIPLIAPLPSLHQWNVMHPAGSAVTLTSLAAGRSARLVTGQRGRLFLSRRLEAFVEVESGVFTNLNDALIDADGAIVVGDAGVILTSSDGEVWTDATSGTSSPLRAVTRGGTGWVAGGDGILLHSTDRRTWTRGTFPAGAIVRDVHWAMGRYVAVGDRQVQMMVLTSTDGLTWTDVTPPGFTSAGRVLSVTSDGQRFLATGFAVPEQKLLSSADGLAWTVTPTEFNRSFSRILHTPDGWLAIAREEEVYRSTDGIAWQLVFDEAFTQVNALAVDDGVLTVAGPRGVVFDAPAAEVFRSATSWEEAWTQQSGADPAEANYYNFRFVAAEGDTIVAVGTQGMNFRSTDGGLTWHRGPNVTLNGFYGLARGAGRFVRTFREGIESSADGVAWEFAAVTDTESLVFGNDRFVAARRTGGFMISTDGRTWTAASPATPRSTALAFGNGRFLARDDSGNVRWSADGVTWTALGPVSSFGVFCFARDRFFARVGSVLSFSIDGESWEPANWPLGVLLPELIVWHRDRFVALGPSPQSSTDLASWTPVPIPVESPAAAVSLAGALLVAGDGQALLLAPDPVPVTAPPVPPVTLTAGARIAENILTFTITGPSGQSVTLERSPDLNAWTAVQTFTLSGNAEILEVQIPEPNPQEYFRLRWVP